MLSAAETNISGRIQRSEREMSSQKLIIGLDGKGATRQTRQAQGSLRRGLTNSET